MSTNTSTNANAHTSIDIRGHSASSGSAGAHSHSHGHIHSPVHPKSNMTADSTVTDSHTQKHPTELHLVHGQNSHSADDSHAHSHSHSHSQKHPVTVSLSASQSDEKMVDDVDVADDALIRLKHKQVAASTRMFWFVSLSVSSIGMVLANKMVVHMLRMPLLTLLFQNFCSIVFSITAAKLGWLEMKPWRVKDIFRFTVPTLIFATMLASSLMAMPYVAIGTIVVFKCAGTVLVAVLDRVVFGVRIGTESRQALAVIMAGSCVYWYTDGNFHSTGYAWLTLNLLCNAANNLYQKFVVVSVEQTPAGSSCYMALLSLPMVFIISFWSGEFEGAYTRLESLLTVPVAAVLLLTGVFGLLISLSYNTLFTISASTSIMVASTANKLVSVVLGMLLFSSKWNLSSAVGLIMSLYGAYLYSQARTREKSLAKTTKE